MVTRFSASEKVVLRGAVQLVKEADMKFTITHPMHSHPYNPELVTGSGIAAVAAAAEAAGFDGFGFTDHPAPTQRWLESGGHDALDPFVAMGFAAAHTTTLRLIPNIVVLPYRNPFVVAKSGATLDLISDGRFTLAVGVGYLKREFAALGVDFDERAALFEEALEVIRAIWTDDDIFYEGKEFTAKGITAHPRPVTKPHPPIWIGGNTAAARERVTKYGDGWCPFPAPAVLAQTARTAALDSLEALGAGIDDLRRRCEAAGRDPSAIDVSFTNAEGGSPGGDAFNPDAYLSGVEKLGALGVTWLQVGLPGDSLPHVLETIDRFRTLVIDKA
jgi:probable F420-dependent oxidoreductase